MSEPNRQYIPTSVETALRDWIVASLDAAAFDDVVVRFAQQGKVRSPKAYVTIEILTDQELQTPVERLTGTVLADGTHEVCMIENREGTVEIISHGENSWAIAKAIARSPWRQDIIGFNSSNNSGLKLNIQDAITAITNLPNPMSTTTEQRRQQDFRFSYAESTTLETGRGVLERAIALAQNNVYKQDPGDGTTAEADESWPTP